MEITQIILIEEGIKNVKLEVDSKTAHKWEGQKGWHDAESWLLYIKAKNRKTKSGNNDVTS